MFVGLSWAFRADKACNMAYDAVATVKTEDRGRMEVDIKRYVRVEKVHAFVILSSQRCCSVHLFTALLHVP